MSFVSWENGNVRLDVPSPRGDTLYINLINIDQKHKTL